MMRVLVRLQWMQLAGRVTRSIRLLRQPKYLVGFVVGAGWMALWVLRPLLRSQVHIGPTPMSAFGVELMPLIRRIVAVAVTIGLPLPWLLPWGRLGLPFREAELTMLLQAPLQRRQIIQYGLLKSELSVLISGLLIPMFVGLGGPGARLLMGCGTWMLFEFWHLNGKWRALFNLRQTEIPASSARIRRLLLTIGLVGFYAALAFALRPLVLGLLRGLSGNDFQQVSGNLVAVAWPPLLEALLRPASWLTGPMFAGNVGAFAVAAVPVILAIAVQRELVLRSKARFEESALEHAKRQEAKKSSTRKSVRIGLGTRTSRPFSIDSVGRPEAALVWKNVMRVSRIRWIHLAYLGMFVLAVVALLPVMLRLHEGSYYVIAMFGIVSMIMQPLLVGMTWKNDLRAELAHIELVRTWPILARRLVLAEVISPALLSFASATFGASVVLACYFGSRLYQPLTGRASELVLLPKTGSFMGVGPNIGIVLLFISFLPIAAAVSFFSSALQNLATLFVPAWMAHTADRNRGVAIMGQRLLISAGLGLALLLGLLPGALVVALVATAQWWIGIAWSAWELPIWAVLAAGPQLALGWLLADFAGRLWEALDPSQEILELGR